MTQAIQDRKAVSKSVESFPVRPDSNYGQLFMEMEEIISGLAVNLDSIDTRLVTLGATGTDGVSSSLDPAVNMLQLTHALNDRLRGLRSRTEDMVGRLNELV